MYMQVLMVLWAQVVASMDHGAVEYVATMKPLKNRQVRKTTV